MLDKRDIALQTLTPCVMVPKFSGLEPLQASGHRFLLANDGLWLDIKRAWLDLTVPLALQHLVPIPCGQLKEKMHFNFGLLPTKFLKQFLNDARKSLPNECAAWFIWNEKTGEMRYELLAENAASITALSYQCPYLEEDEHLIADIHSHGNDAAFFSYDDNNDDKTVVKIAVVIGNVSQQNISIKMRLCANGYFIDLPCIGMEDIGDDHA